MKGEFRFRRTYGGITSFAAVVVSSHPSAVWNTAWRSGLERMRRAWEGEVEKGIKSAADEHARRGGEPHSVEVELVEDVPADTKSDAMICAATIAAWKSLGWNEVDIKVERADGTWRVAFA